MIKTKDVLERLDRAIAEGLAHDEPRGLVYHYTGEKGLEGILQSKGVWATQFQYLNDTREFKEGEAIVRAVSEELSDEVGLSLTQKMIRKGFCATQEHMAFTRIMNSTFIASFSELGDDLSQWRAYGFGGAGYSLGFRFYKSDAKPSIVSHLGAVFKQVLYDAEASRQRIRNRLVDAFTTMERFSQLRHLRDDQRETIMHRGMVLTHQRAGVLVLPIKNHHFAAEREWRAIIMPRVHAHGGVVKTRNGNVRYVELPLVSGADDLLELETLYVGPTEDPHGRAQRARALLQSLGYSPNIVKISEVPLRR